MKKQKGFGLTGALAGSAIVGIIAVGVMQLFQQLVTSQTLVKISSQRDVTHEEIRAVLSSIQACRNTFGAIPMVNGTEVSLSSIKDTGSPPADLFVAGGIYGNGALQISSMRFAYNDGGAGVTLGLGTLTVSYESAAQDGAIGSFRPQQMLISTEKDSITNTLVKCVALAKMSDGIWTRVPGTLANTFFSGGNVGIGTSTPSANLHVRGTSIRIDRAITPVSGPVLDFFNDTVNIGQIAAVQNGGSGSALSFYTRTAGSNLGSPKMVIDNAGCITAGVVIIGGNCVSDERMKTKVRPFDLGLDALSGIKPQTFWYTGLGGHPKSTRPELGVIAQEVEKTAPELVTESEIRLSPGDLHPTTMKRVNYSALTFILVNSVNDLHKLRVQDAQRIKELELRLGKLEKLLNTSK